MMKRGAGVYLALKTNKQTEHPGHVPYVFELEKSMLWAWPVEDCSVSLRL